MSTNSDSPRSVRPLSPATRRRSLTAESNHDLSLRFFAAVFAQWWKILVPTTLALLAISVGIVMFWFEPQYRASAWLQVKSEQPFVAFPDGKPFDREAARKFVFTQIELLRSPLILSRALSQPEIAQLPEFRWQRDPVEWLATKGLVVTPKGDSELLEVTFTGSDPASSAKVVDAVVNAYFGVRAEKSDAQIQKVIMLLENEKSRRAEGIKLLQSEIRQLQAQLMGKDPAMVTNTLAAGDIVISDNPLKTVQDNLGRAQIDTRVLEAQVNSLEGTVDQPTVVPDILIDRQVDQRPEIQQTIEQLNHKRALLDQIASLSAQADQDPRYRRTEQEIAQLEATLSSLREAGRPRIREELESMASLDRREKLNSLRQQLSTQSLIVDNLRASYDAMVKDLALSGSQTLDLRMKQRELDRRQEVHDRISDRAAQLATEMYAPQRVELIQDATAPLIPVESLPWKLLLASVLASLTLPLAACVLWEKSVRRVTSIEQLQHEAALPVVGEIARLPLRQGRKPDEQRSLDYELGVFEESIDSLRTGLVLSHEHDEMGILAVSSAVSGEGKSSVASQLAVSLARSSSLPILLIDGDMRSPDLHRIFKLALEPGLADVLAGGKPMSACVNREWSEHVHILPAGKLTKSPHKLVGSERFAQLLEWARHHYRYVVIDTPPILAASEAMVMARAADATLICAMRDVSRENHVRLTYQRLLAVGANPVGTVLSGVPTRQYARRYGSYVYSSK